MIIELYDSRGKLVDYLYQWDRDVELTIKNNGNHKISEVHFSNLASDRALVLEPYDRGRKIKVPNLLLTKIHALVAHFCAINENGGLETVFEYIIPIRPRQKPDDYVYTETEVLTYSNLEKRVLDLEEKGISDVVISDAVEEYFQENPIKTVDLTPYVTKTQLNDAIYSSLGVIENGSY